MVQPALVQLECTASFLQPSPVLRRLVQPVLPAGWGLVFSLNQMKTCSVTGCQRKVVARGWCGAHWQRWKNNGDTNPLRPINNQYGQWNPRWKGGVIKFGDGRILVYSPNHPYPSTMKHVFRYRLVMEEALGRYLLPSELVHHKNGDVTDDRLENLELHDHVSHAKLHDKQRGRNAKGQFNSGKPHYE